MEQEQKSSNYLFAYEALKSAYPQMKGLRVRAQAMTLVQGNAQYQNQNKADCIIFVSAVMGDGQLMTFTTYQLQPNGVIGEHVTIDLASKTINNYWIRACDIVIIQDNNYPILNVVIYEPIL